MTESEVLRILHVVPSYLPAVRYGGPIVSVHGLCRALAHAGHEVHVFTTNLDGPSESPVPLNEPVLLDGVRVWYFGVPFLRRLYWSPDLGAALRAQAPRFDVLHLHSVFLWPTWAAARAAARSGTPYVISPRGMLVRELIRRKNRWLKTLWIGLFERRIFEGAAAIHFTSRSEKDEFAAFHMRSRRLVMLSNGVELSADDEVSDSVSNLVDAIGKGPFVLFLGRINWKKGLDRLIKAVKFIPGPRFVIAGNDEEAYTRELVALAAREGVSERLVFAGPVYGPDKAFLYRRAELLVLPSYSENFGNVVLEAMAEGCPVVVTPEVGAASIVTESGGGLVVDGDPSALADGIRKFLSDPELRAASGRRGREAVRAGYSWNAIADRMACTYREIVDQDRTAGP